MLGVVMLLFALLVQPVCVLYTKTVMSHAAAETLRVLATTRDVETARSFARRRLEAVVPASVFHVGGEGDWCVSVERSSTDEASVQIAGHVRPLPLMGALAALMGTSDREGIVLEVRQSGHIRQTWLEGDYESWMGAWE